MKPPICEFCHRDFRTSEEEGGLVRFSDYKPLPEMMTGHPHGLAWFCGIHLDQAKALQDQPIQKALELMRQSN